MIILIRSIIICLFVIIVINQYRIETMSFVPISLPINTIEDNPIKRKLESLGVKSTPQLVDAISFASSQYKISSDLIIALIMTESAFKKDATSSLGYKGLMQIPNDVYHKDANIMIGTRILNEKIRIAKNDMDKALLLYKGYPLDSERGKEQIQKVYKIYHKLKEIR